MKYGRHSVVARLEPCRLDYWICTTDAKDDVALPYGAEKPRLKHPPARYVWFKEPAFSSGIERKRADGFPLRVYSAGKTVADCFKARNKIGLDVAIEALKLCREKRRAGADELIKFARVCRVEKIMRP